MKNPIIHVPNCDLEHPARKNCVDVWNAAFVSSCRYDNYDIPYCPTFLPKGLPKELISYTKAKSIYNQKMKSNQTNFYIDAFVHFFVDDQNFDGKKNSIWLFPQNAIDVLSHFAGAITVDYSTYSDFPHPIKLYNTYRMRVTGLAFQSNGIPTINNVRWGTYETWDYCFQGIPKDSVVAIGTVASGLRSLENREEFKDGLFEMVRQLAPKIIIVYGSSNYDFFDELKKQGIRILQFDSETNIAYKGGEQ